MRGGICSIQLQALTPEAATVVKQAVNLATRRGHAQVTPLHVASAMLATSTGLLRKACLQCHSHPLQCKALELCFNVALNRLPASTPSPLLGPQYTTPSLSNALVAAFKRAQAHQRRGSIENQQQHILALKIEVEQLIISILDDPSVSRVMREAGFSSTLVKSRVEQAVPMEVCSQKAPDRSQSKESTKPQVCSNVSPSRPFGQVGGSFIKPVHVDLVNNDDVTSVLSELVKRRRNTVIVGESLANAEGVARGVMDRFEVGNVPGDLRYVQFVSLPLICFRNISKEEVEQKLVEVRSLVKSYVGRGVILYLGDMKCDFQAQERRKVLFKDMPFEDRVGVQKHLTCCRDCSRNFEKEAQSITNNYNSIGKKVCTASLPTWLQNCKEERNHIMEDQESARLKDLCKKWNSICNSVHRPPSILEKPVFFVSSTPSSPTSVSSHEGKSNLHHSHLNWPIISEPEKVPKECELYTEAGDDCYDGNLIMFMPDRNVNIPKPDLLSNPNSSPNSASSSEAVDGLESTQMFKELNAENLKILNDALEKKVPQHKEIIPEIASTVLLCRSGMRKRENHWMKREDKQETWMFFLGVHSQAKESISRELAKVVFGSYSNFVTISMNSFSSLGDDSTDEKSKRKRPRDELGSTYLQRFGEAANENPHRVFFLEDLEQVDYFSQKGIKKAIESGSITLPCGESVPLKDAIVIFSSESFSSVSRSPARMSPSAESKGKEIMDDKSPSLSLDLNIAIEDDSRCMTLGGDTGILELVDKQISFNIQEL
ncbi:P-loop containing nucleoside triphosphate hydrolase [Sesbania bispinosa]|nr:P-loop containing nucleoside triphosphate hydrolase [Sesbania bispinosa]